MSKLVSELHKEPTSPKGWELTKLDQLVIDPKSSIVDGPFGSDLKKSEYIEEGVPVIRLQNIEPGKLIKKNLRYITQKKAKQLDRHNFTVNDIVITKLGDPLGEATLIPEDMNNGIIVADIVRIRTNNRFVSPKFLTYYLNSPYVINQLKIKTKGTTRPRVNLHHIRDLDILLPPLNEQKRIALKIEEFFSILDDLIANLAKTIFRIDYCYQLILNSFTKNSHKTIFEKLILEKPRNGLYKSKEFQGRGNRWIKMNILYGNEIITDQEMDYVLVNSKEEEKFSCKEGDLLFGRTSVVLSGVGTCSLIGKITDKPIFESNTFRIRLNQKLTMPKFFFYYFRSPLGRKEVLNLAKQTIVAQITSTSLVKLKVPYPTISEQTKAIEMIDDYTSKLVMIKERCNVLFKTLGSLKQIILKQTLEGKLVPQDPNDEPAEILLEKIKKENEKLQKNKKATIKIKTRRKKK